MSDAGSLHPASTFGIPSTINVRQLHSSVTPRKEPATPGTAVAAAFPCGFQRSSSGLADVRQVFHALDVRKRIGRTCSIVVFGPRMDCAAQRNLIVVDFNLYLVCVDLGASFEGFGEFGFDVLSRHAMFERDETRNAANAGLKLHSAPGVVDLILPVDFAFQCYPAIVDLRLNELLGNGNAPVERIQYGLCDVAVVAMMERRNFDLEFIGKRMNARYTLRCLFGRQLFGIVANRSASVTTPFSTVTPMWLGVTSGSKANSSSMSC